MTDDINAQVAEKVMGWHEGQDFVLRKTDGTIALYKLHHDYLVYDKDWNPSHSISDAWLVVEEMRRRGWYYYSIQDQTDVPEEKREGLVRVCFGCNRKYERAKVVYGFGDTTPEAICKAALAALENPNDQ